MITEKDKTKKLNTIESDIAVKKAELKRLEDEKKAEEHCIREEKRRKENEEFERKKNSMVNRYAEMHYINRAVAENAFKYAYEDGHAYGWNSVEERMDFYCDFAEESIRLMGE